MQKYIAITGASSGIGRAAARAFAARGKNLILIARRQKLLYELKFELEREFEGLDIVVIPTDLTAPKAAQLLYDELKIYEKETWINNAGFGDYSFVSGQNLEKIDAMIELNIKAVTTLSTLFVREHQSVDGAQLINVSSAGGYAIIPNAVTYCASKFYISAFTEGLWWEMKRSGLKMQVKLLAPATTKTEFGAAATGVEDYNYDERFKNYHTSEEVAQFLLELYDSDKCVGVVDPNTFKFSLTEPKFDYAGRE